MPLCSLACASSFSKNCFRSACKYFPARERKNSHCSTEWMLFFVPGSNVAFFWGMIIPHSIGNPYFRYIKPTIGFFEHPLWKQLEFRSHHIWRWCNIFSIFSPFYLEKLKNLTVSVSPFEGGLYRHENQVNWPQNWHLKTCILNCMKYETTPPNHKYRRFSGR